VKNAMRGKMTEKIQVPKYIYIYNIITNLLILKKNLYLIPPHGGIVHCKKAKNLISFFLHYLYFMFYGTKQENAT
jgi:hypothetical protein